MRGTPRQVVLEEVEHMLSFGESPAGIAAVLGIKPDSVAKSLWRSGRGDLAVKFERQRSSRNGECIDCGAHVSDPRAPRCRRCGYIARSADLHAGKTHCPTPGCKRYLKDGACRAHGRMGAAA